MKLSRVSNFRKNSICRFFTPLTKIMIRKSYLIGRVIKRCIKLIPSTLILLFVICVTILSLIQITMITRSNPSPTIPSIIGSNQSRLKLMNQKLINESKLINRLFQDNNNLISPSSRMSPLKFDARGEEDETPDSLMDRKRGKLETRREKENNVIMSNSFPVGNVPNTSSLQRIPIQFNGQQKQEQQQRQQQRFQSQGIKDQAIRPSDAFSSPSFYSSANPDEDIGSHDSITRQSQVSEKEEREKKEEESGGGEEKFIREEKREEKVPKVDAWNRFNDQKQMLHNSMALLEKVTKSDLNAKKGKEESIKSFSSLSRFFKLLNKKETTDLLNHILSQDQKVEIFTEVNSTPENNFLKSNELQRITDHKMETDGRKKEGSRKEKEEEERRRNIAMSELLLQFLVTLDNRIENEKKINGSNNNDGYNLRDGRKDGDKIWFPLLSSPSSASSSLSKISPRDNDIQEGFSYGNYGSMKRGNKREGNGKVEEEEMRKLFTSGKFGVKNNFLLSSSKKRIKDGKEKLLLDRMIEEEKEKKEEEKANELNFSRLSDLIALFVRRREEERRRKEQNDEGDRRKDEDESIPSQTDEGRREKEKIDESKKKSNVLSSGTSGDDDGTYFSFREEEERKRSSRTGVIPSVNTTKEIDSVVGRRKERERKDDLLVGREKEESVMKKEEKVKEERTRSDHVETFNGPKVMDMEEREKKKENKQMDSKGKKSKEEDGEEGKKDERDSDGWTSIEKRLKKEEKKEEIEKKKTSGERKEERTKKEQLSDSNHFQVSAGKNNVLLSSSSSFSQHPHPFSSYITSNEREKEKKLVVKKEQEEESNGTTSTERKEGEILTHSSSSSFFPSSSSSSSFVSSASITKSQEEVSKSLSGYKNPQSFAINKTRGDAQEQNHDTISSHEKDDTAVVKGEEESEERKLKSDPIKSNDHSSFGEYHDHGHNHSSDSSLNHETLDLSLNESKAKEKEAKDKHSKRDKHLALSLISTQCHPSHNVPLSGHNLSSLATDTVHNDETSQGLIKGQLSQKPLCPQVPPFLVGRMKPNLNPDVGVNMSNAIKMNPKVQLGGVYEPTDCISRSNVAIIIPYRDRQTHLETLLYHLHPLLQRQQISYAIYVIEQWGDDTFNKGVLMNAGAIESAKDHPNTECYIFHDVDLIPEDDRNLYNCPSNSPRHMSPAIDKFNYTLPYNYLVGGVLAISKSNYSLVNGYSNLYWGWGGEDDDIAHRMSAKKLKIIRPPNEVGRYKMIKHNHRKESPSNVRSALLRMAKRRASRDGLSSVHYTIKSVAKERLYTKITIEIGHIHKWHFPAPNKLVLHF